MNEQLALLKSICDNPTCDTARLVYADWLDENNQPEHAEFIRVQIGMSNIPAWGPVDQYYEHHQLKARERELWNKTDWRGLSTSWWVSSQVQPSAKPFPTETLSKKAEDGEIEYIDAFWHRGFRQAIWTTLDTFMTHAIDFFQTNPITNVMLNDRSPGSGRMWGTLQHPPITEGLFIISTPSLPQPAMLPRELFRCLPDRSHQFLAIYDDEQQAREALVTACLRYGRGWTPAQESEPLKENEHETANATD